MYGTFSISVTSTVLDVFGPGSTFNVDDYICYKNIHMVSCVFQIKIRKNTAWDFVTSEMGKHHTIVYYQRYGSRFFQSSRKETKAVCYDGKWSIFTPREVWISLATNQTGN